MDVMAWSRDEMISMFTWDWGANSWDWRPKEPSSRTVSLGVSLDDDERCRSSGL